MARCQGIKRDGGRCTASVPEGSQWCFNHDPRRASERQHNASRAGKSHPRASQEMKDLKRRISEVVDAVLEGSQDRGRAAVAIQGFNALKGVLELERKVKETEELEERIERLETKIQPRGGRAWQARR
jgi:hypothetical protein